MNGVGAKRSVEYQRRTINDWGYVFMASETVNYALLGTVQQRRRIIPPQVESDKEVPWISSSSKPVVPSGVDLYHMCATNRQF